MSDDTPKKRRRRRRPKIDLGRNEGRQWSAALRAAIRERAYDNGTDYNVEMVRLAEQLLRLVEAGDIQAIRELGDRIEGRPKQTLAGDEDNPLLPGLIKIAFKGTDDD